MTLTQGRIAFSLLDHWTHTGQYTERQAFRFFILHRRKRGCVSGSWRLVWCGFAAEYEHCPRCTTGAFDLLRQACSLGTLHVGAHRA